MKLNIVQHTTLTDSRVKLNPAPNKSGESFNRLLMDKLQAGPKVQPVIKISNHARQRLEKRKIAMSDPDLSKLNEALEKVKKKGSRETMVFYKNNAYLFNVKTSTLITAIDKNSMQGSVITNIDSTIFI